MNNTKYTADLLREFNKFASKNNAFDTMEFHQRNPSSLNTAVSNGTASYWDYMNNQFNGLKNGYKQTQGPLSIIGNGTADLFKKIHNYNVNVYKGLQNAATYMNPVTLGYNTLKKYFSR